MVPKKSDFQSVCFVANWFRPGYKAGGVIRSLDHLVQNIHSCINITVLTSSNDFGHFPLEVPHNEEVKYKDCSVWYLPPKTILKGRMLKKIIALNSGVVYMNSMFSLHFTIIPLLFFRFSKYTPTLILAPEGMLQRGAIQNKYLKKHLFFILFKILGIHKMVTFHTTNESEKNDLIRVFGEKMKIKVIPHFTALPVEKVKIIPKQAGSASFVFVSLLTKKKNLHFFLELLKELEDDVKLTFIIYGIIKDKAYWQKCLKRIATFNKGIKIEFKGELLHKDVASHLEQAHFFVLPTHGENFGHAIFEALQVGRPVLISDNTPWRQMEEKQAGWDIPLDDIEKWKTTIRTCCQMDATEYRRFSEGAHRFAVKFSHENKNAQLYRELFGSIN